MTAVPVPVVTASCTSFVPRSVRAICAPLMTAPAGSCTVMLRAPVERFCAWANGSVVIRARQAPMTIPPAILLANFPEFMGSILSRDLLTASLSDFVRGWEARTRRRPEYVSLFPVLYSARCSKMYSFMYASVKIERDTGRQNPGVTARRRFLKLRKCKPVLNFDFGKGFKSRAGTNLPVLRPARDGDAANLGDAWHESGAVCEAMRPSSSRNSARRSDRADRKDIFAVAKLAGVSSATVSRTINNVRTGNPK